MSGVFAVLALAGASPPVSAGPALPSVTIESLSGTVFNHVSCQGEEQLSEGSGAFQVFRGSAEPTPLSVALTYAGTLVPGVDYDALPATLTIPADETNVVVFFRSLVTGSVTASVEPDLTYRVGSPAIASSTLTGPVDQHECGATEPQTINVGERPVDIDVYGTFGSFVQIGGLEIEGAVPPGLTFHPEGTWEGTATTAGAFEFVARYCIRGAGCVFNLTVAVTVVGTDTAPASPVVASPTFTG